MSIDFRFGATNVLRAALVNGAGTGVTGATVIATIAGTDIDAEEFAEEGLGAYTLVVPKGTLPIPNAQYLAVVDSNAGVNMDDHTEVTINNKVDTD